MEHRPRSSPCRKLHLGPTGLASIEGLVGFQDVRQRFGLDKHLFSVNSVVSNRFDYLGNVMSMIAVSHLQGEVAVHGHSDRKEPMRRRINADDRDRVRLGD